MATAPTFRALGLLAAVAVAAAAWFLRDDIFQTLQDPGVPFQTYARPPAPDYSDPESWIAWPGEPVGTGASVFVVVPEVYKGSESWNLPVADARRREKLERIVRPNYVDPYRDAGRLFAPLYRQAALYAFLNNREDSQQAQDLAYRDVERAWDAFLDSTPTGGPIVLVGHGQGAAHAQRLLRERVGKQELRRLAAAFIVDYPLVAADLDIPVCETATQTGCVVAWTAVMPDDTSRADRFRHTTLVHDGSRYVATDGRDLVCVNPLTWRTDGDVADRGLHKGGVGAVGFEPDVRPVVHDAQVSAQCRDGLLNVSEPDVRSLRRPWKLVGGAFRTLPSNLFYEDLRINARQRVESWRASDL